MRRASAALRRAQARQLKLEQFSIEDAARRERLSDVLWELVRAVEGGANVEAALMRARRHLGSTRGRDE